MSKWYPKNGRVIFHIDMNCFYAAVEMTYDDTLKGKPIAIAGNPEERKGIIVTSSYEARAKGVKTTMPLWQAKRLCPNLIVLSPNFDRYRKASQKMFQILAEITPMIQPVSIDEGYLDITDCHHLGNPIKVAEQLQKRILNELDLPCSIGIAPNKFLAKMASDMKKPLGISVLRLRELKNILWPMSVGEMYGVGEKTAEKLKTIEISTIGDLAERDVYDLTQLLGINGERLKNRANGIDERPVDPDAVNEFKSIGSSRTFPYDVTNENEINKMLKELSLNVERRIKRKEAVGSSIQVMIRFHNRDTITRSKKLNMYIDDHNDIYNIAHDLFYLHWNLDAIRLLGVTIQDIEERKNIYQQLNLFTYEEDIVRAKLQSTVDSLTEKYGKNTFKKLKSKNDSDQLTTSFQKDFLNDYRKK